MALLPAERLQAMVIQWEALQPRAQDLPAEVHADGVLRDPVGLVLEALPDHEHVDGAPEQAPDHAEAWHLLGACQERNPKWRRDAAESFQRALSLDPNSVEVLISLGDLYRIEGLISRAQSCYEDVLKIAADHPEAKSRLAGIRKK